MNEQQKSFPTFHHKSIEERILYVLNKIGPIAAIGTVAFPIAIAFIPPSPQNLPIGAIMKVQNQAIELEVASSPNQLATGLKERHYLPQNRGMLFVIGKPQTVKMWMKNVKIPLDMVFIQDNTVKTVVENVPPCAKIDNCPYYDSVYPVNRIVELRAGRAKILGIKPGIQLEINFISQKSQ
ncbi:hypothetical protein WA1_49245 [Scytonema hofmannii PCC 7110]|uniref:DUF192 domain-containing protein n=1 Tax=Scytonema hofmannii PCC 7110 TaxID=128403 RepID=A0A139WQM6_9CYAN|nr:DUF192 domain-containing protein [Scytonema hofmannii]KYC34727.1 hypothetical protein WA1_49245 [Scytonema hofmannii PCC 7110]